MLKTPQERVTLLKTGVDLSTIEKLYLKHNNIRLIQKPVLFDAFRGKLPDDMCRASQFERIYVKAPYTKPEFLLITGLMLLIIGFIYPSSVLITVLLGFLFIPPVMTAGLLMLELIRSILKEIELLLVSRTAKVIFH